MLGRLKTAVRRTPGLGSMAAGAGRIMRKLTFPGSAGYWERRYAKGGTSGSGSYGRLAAFKAEVINGLVEQEKIASVVEFGCGDGNQLSLARYPRYLGLDVSRAAISICSTRFSDDASKSFFLYEPAVFSDKARFLHADLALSLDVIYHLVEDQAFEMHMRHLFAAADRFVVIYSSNIDAKAASAHVRHRRFTDWIERNLADWDLFERTDNRYPSAALGTFGSHADFYVYGRARPAPDQAPNHA